MLDFIVLGIVPGTNFIITVSWVLVVALAFSLMALLYIEIKKPRKSSDASEQTLSLETAN